MNWNSSDETITARISQLGLPELEKNNIHERWKRIMAAATRECG